MTQDQDAAILGDIGRRIRSAREASHLNLHDLARLSGVSAPALSLIENGKRDLRITTLYRVAGALRTDVAALLSQPAAAGPEAITPADAGYDLTDYL